MTARRWAAAIFAHNEEEHIAACVESVVRAAHDRPIDVVVMSNGCTDRTDDVVSDLARRLPGLRLVSVRFPDKVNAWNLYVHEVAPDCDVHFFVDGDVAVRPPALARLDTALATQPHAHAAAGVPASGRSGARLRHQILEDHGLVGNLYALRGAFVQRLRRERIKLPIGIVFEDSLVGVLAKTDLDPRRPWDSERVVPVADAEFVFGSLTWRRLDHWHLYWRRRIRYSTGHLQQRMLSARLRRDGITAMPATVRDLYRTGDPQLRLRGALDVLFDLIALHRIRRQRRSA